MSEQAQNPNQDPLFAQSFIDNLEAVTAYNSRHTGLGGAVRGIFDMIMSQVEDHEPPKVTASEEAEMEKEMVQFLRTDELAALGIGLFDSSASGIKQVSDEELGNKDKRPASLVLLVIDGEKFGETVDRLKPAPEQQQRVDSHINMLLSQTVALIKAGYDVTAESDEHGEYALRQLVDQQLDMFIELTPKLVAGGFGELPAYGDLSEYTARYVTGTLGDYIGAESLGLLQRDFGPDGWQKDITAERLGERWNRAFGYLLKLRDREEPSSFYTELFTKLRGDFDKAQAWLEGEEADEYRANYSDEYINSLRKETTELSKMWDEQFALENAMYSPNTHKND